MYFRNIYFLTAYRILSVAFLFYGILCHISFTNEKITTYNLSFFTVQSNLLCLICFCLLLFRTKQGKQYSLTNLKYAATLCIIVTFLCFNYVVISAETYMGTILDLEMKNFIAHYVAPLLVVLDWLLFQPKGNISWYSPILWMIAPMSYFLIIVTRALCNPPEVVKYPYFFLDVNKIGSHIFIFIGIYIFMFLIVGYLLFCVDKLIAGLPLLVHRLCNNKISYNIQQQVRRFKTHGARNKSTQVNGNTEVTIDLNISA